MQKFCRVAVAVIALGLVGCGKGERLTAPKSFVAFEAIDKSFKGVAPEGWKVQRSGLQGTVAGAKISQQDATVQITADLQGSLMGDMMTASNSQMGGLTEGLPENMRPPAGMTKPAVEKLHAAGEKAGSKGLENYEEKPMQTLQSPLGEGRFSEFTGEEKGYIGGEKYHGLRVTILSGERRVTVVARCLEENWATLRPAFERVITGLAPGSN